MSEWHFYKEKTPEKDGTYLVYGMTPDCYCYKKMTQILANWREGHFQLREEFRCKLSVRRWKDIGLNEEIKDAQSN